jgi:hypothetical protein
MTHPIGPMLPTVEALLRELDLFHVNDISVSVAHGEIHLTLTGDATVAVERLNAIAAAFHVRPEAVEHEDRVHLAVRFTWATASVRAAVVLPAGQAVPA